MFMSECRLKSRFCKVKQTSIIQKTGFNYLKNTILADLK